MPRLLAFFQTDCPTCRLIVPYWNRLPVHAYSQDDDSRSREFCSQTGASFPVEHDAGWALSKRYAVETVPTLVVVDDAGNAIRTEPGFDKKSLNEVAAMVGLGPVAPQHDGAPQSKPGCSSRHLEAITDDADAPALDLYGTRGEAAGILAVNDDEDAIEYCFRQFGDALPVVPPTRERVERMLRGTKLDRHEIIGRIPPCFGAATVEKIAANAVMAGCTPDLMRVLIPLVRAVCDERFNAHGVQATTHSASPLTVLNGPVCKEFGYHARQNLFSNVARANSTTGRALQLLLLNVGGGRPTGIDMSALGNAGKFSFCIAENEEQSPWEPLHCEHGFTRDQSALTLLACDSPHGVSEHLSRTARGVLKAVSHALATVWSYRACMGFEALVVLCPEHAATIHRDGWSKEDTRNWLFENTGIPVRCYDDPDIGDGDGVNMRAMYQEVTIAGERCYRKFASPKQIRIIVAGGTAGKFSAVLGSWLTGPRGSQAVTYPIE